MGAKVYGLLRSYFAPAEPKTKSLAQFATALKGHFQPKCNVVAECFRFRFHRQKQHARESVSKYVAKLRKLAASCAFWGNYLEEALRDQLVCGLKSEAVQRKLLSEGDMKLNKAVEIAQNMEAVQKGAKGAGPRVDSGCCNVPQESRYGPIIQ